MGSLDSSLDIANRSLALLAANPITSFVDESIEAFTASQFYEHVLRSLLTDHYWRFAAKTTSLAKLSGAPVGDVWERRFALPDDYLVARDIAQQSQGFGSFSGQFDRVASSAGGSYEIFGNEIRTNFTTVFLNYTFRPLEVMFPPYFTDALVYALAHTLAMPITEIRTKSEELAVIAADKRSRAIIQDVQSRPEKLISVSSFIAPRY